MQAVNQLIKLINHGPSTSKLLATHLPIIDHVLTIVDTSLLYNKLVENLSNPETVLMNTAVHFLADMVNEPTILAHIKQKKLTSSFLRLISAPYEPLVHDIYAILALTTSEKDINEMQNPSLLLSPVVRSLKEAVFNYKSDDQTQVLQFLNTLKGLVQHEQIKEEILKKDIFSSLLEWTKNFTGDILTVLLETIWALSFSHSGTLELRKHPEFLEKIQTIAQSASSEELKKASEGLVWKLVQEPAFLEKAEQKRKEQNENMVEEDIETTEVVIGPDGKEQIVKKTRRVSIAPAEQTFQYDMMISYCHADKDLIYKIHKFLLDQGFKIWIDLNNMFGPAMSAMAEAVENSEFVLICMSDSYKQSTYCQAEAEYAFGCKRRLLPLIVRPGYKADGWLGFMMGSRIYIDFGRFDFDTGCDKLMNEIALQRKRPLPSKESKVGQHEKPDDKIPTITITTEKSSPSLTPSPRSPTPPSISGKLPDIYMKRSASFQYRLKPIHQWIESDVLDFLYSNQIQEFMPVCEKMDGRALIQLYKMSVSHSKSTYVLLNDELKSTHQVRLPIGSFTRFLSIMERVAGSYLQSSLSITPIKEQPQITTTTLTTAPPTEPYSSMLPLPAPIHLQETHQNNSTPSYYRQSNFPYDILVTSNASASELLKMADRFILKYMR
ncbi:hypothetical protein I4U23_024801 [Adineta vaga]|nr:hypothetical protein I4U23_024801 [Adineta vaga]